MSYSGATAASSLANPPVPIASALYRMSDTSSTAGPQPRGAQLWWYCSSNATSDVSAANAITDGYYLGMRPGDVMIGSYFSSLGSTTGYSYRLTVTGVTTSGVTFSTGQQST